MLNILSGWQTANIKSFEIADNVKLDQGDWVVFDQGKLKKQTGTYAGAGAVFPVYAGNVSFYDTRYHNRADVVTAKSAVLESDKVAAVSIVAGDPVTVVDGVLAKGTATNAIGFAIADMKDGVLQIQLGR